MTGNAEFLFRTIFAAVVEWAAPVDQGVFEVGARKYKSLNVEKKGYCLAVNMLDATGDNNTVSQIAQDLSELCEQVAWMEDIRVVLFAFSGEIKNPGFRSGENNPEPDFWAEPAALLKQPVIAAIRGNALGLGLELALACDIRIGTEDACFGLPQICEGTIPSNGGTQRLPRLIGPGRAMRMILTGESIDAGEAHRIGLLNSVVASDVLMPTAEEMARKMATKSPLSLSYAKEALYSARDLTLDQGLNKELDLYLLLQSTQDRIEGITAFKEKRKPEFKGM